MKPPRPPRLSNPAFRSQCVRALIVEARQGFGECVFDAKRVRAFEVEVYARIARDRRQHVFIDHPRLGSASIRHGTGKVGIGRDLRAPMKLGLVERASRKPARVFLIALGEVVEVDGDQPVDVLTG